LQRDHSGYKKSYQLISKQKMPLTAVDAAVAGFVAVLGVRIASESPD